MPRRRTLLLSLLPAPWAAAADAAAAAPPPELQGLLPEARLRGSATLRFFGLHVYDAQLWTPEQAAGAADPLGQPLALALTYGRALVGAQIARRSLDEMQRIGSFSAAQGERWLQAMTALFPDVRAGDRLTGLHLPGRAVRFFHNGLPRGEVADAEFAPLFFGIWLSPRTSEPRLRAQLLGRTP